MPKPDHFEQNDQPDAGPETGVWKEKKGVLEFTPDQEHAEAFEKL